VLASDFSRSRP